MDFRKGNTIWWALVILGVLCIVLLVMSATWEAYILRFIHTYSLGCLFGAAEMRN